MNLQETNTQYLGLKKRLIQTKDEIKRLEQEAEEKRTDKTILLGKLAEAKRSKDVTAEKSIQAQLSPIEKNLKEIDAKAKKQKEALAVIQGEINKKVEEIKSIPGMREHINDIIRKQSERKSEKVKEEELKPLQEKKDKLVQIIQLTALHSTLENNLKAILGATKRLEELHKELDSLRDGVDSKGAPKFKDTKRAAQILNKELQPLETKLKNNKASMLAYLKKNSIEIEEADIDELAKGKVVINKKGEVDLKTTFNTQLAAVDRKIRGVEKSITKLERTSQNLQTPEIQPTPELNPEPEPQYDNTEQPYQYEESAQKPKWWQFIKRFRIWNERRQQRKLEEEYEQDEPSPSVMDIEEPDEPEVAPAQRTNNEFKNSLKYEILRDVVDQEMKEQLKRAKEQGRKNPDGR